MSHSLCVNNKLLIVRTRYLHLNKLRLQYTVSHLHGLWTRHSAAATRLLLCVGEDVGLEVRGLGELFVTTLKRANVRSVPSMNSHVRSQVEIKRKSLSTAFKCALERLLASMNKLVSLQFTRFNKSFTALCTDVNPWTVGVEVFSHRGVVSEHFSAALVRTSYRARNLFMSLLLWFYPSKIC